MSSIRRYKLRQAQRRRRLQADPTTEPSPDSDGYTTEQLQAGDEATVADMAPEQPKRKRRRKTKP